MSDNRKTIKITIPAEMVSSFDKAKKRAEDAAMIKLSDTQYASRLIQYAINGEYETSKIASRLVDMDGLQIDAKLIESGLFDKIMQIKSKELMSVFKKITVKNADDQNISIDVDGVSNIAFVFDKSVLDDVDELVSFISSKCDIN